MKFLDENGLSYLWGKVKTMLEGKQDSATAVTMEQVTQAIAGAAIQTQDIYSLEEQVVGRWIDGKPLYQRTYYVQNFTLQGGIGEERTILSNLPEECDYKFISCITSVGANSLTENVIYRQNLRTFSVKNNHSSIDQIAKIIITALYTKITDQATIELPAMLAVSQPLYTAAPQSAAAVELTAGIGNKEV